jgi:hypothetical protein
MHFPRETFFHVAPIGSGEHKAAGRHPVKPWQFKVTVAIPHLDTLEPLKACIELLRRQTIRPYIMVIDTGSPPAVQLQLEQLRDVDLEIHYINGHAYVHSSEPVTVALDVAHTLCRTEHLFHTHADCFLRRRDFLEFMARITDANNPVAGYRMSPRDWATTEWEWMVGHSALMLYMPSILRAGVTWSFQRIFHAYGYQFKNQGGWPDTETGFNHGLREAGIKPLFIGYEQNFVREMDENRDHVRSYCGGKIYGSENYNVPCAEWMIDALKDAAQRISAWDCQTPAKPVAASQPNPTP